MARPKRYRDSRQAHYTESPSIVSFMVSRLKPSNGDVIWEPCAGGGNLVDGVLETAPLAKLHASEINSDAFTHLQNKYKENTSVLVRNEDALDVGRETLFQEHAAFTRIIGNPPYGAYQTTERRRQLRQRFGQLYVRETYGVILYHAMSLLEKEGRLVFIIPDTFLWLTRHKVLRRMLVSQTAIEEIALFPSRFFPNVNFGYSGLCIITLIKCVPASDHTVRIITGFQEVSALEKCVDKPETGWPCSIKKLRQADISGRPHAELILHNNMGVRSLRTNMTVGDIAEVKTGFYSGNDRRWLRKLNDSVPRSKTYQKICENRIAIGAPSLAGFDGNRTFIPIVRGGAAPYIKPTHWFVDWSVAAISEYTRKGTNPARFQNSSFYFRDGIGVPMVGSGRITGAILECRVFDQGIVGIFPYDEKLNLFFLGYFNSSIATYFIRQINPTANNSANYIKRLPIVIPRFDELNLIHVLVRKAIVEVKKRGFVSDDVKKKIDSVYSDLWNRF